MKPSLLKIPVSLVGLVSLGIAVSFAQQDWGFEWQHPRPQGNTLWDIIEVSENVGGESIVARIAVGGAFGTYIRGDDEEIIYSVDGTPSTITDFKRKDEIVVGLLADNKLIRFMDDGLSWILLNSPPTVGFLETVNFVDGNPDIIFTGGFDGEIWKTIDGGANWVLQDTPTNERMTALIVWSEDQLQAFGDAGTILETFDGGTTWEIQEPPIVTSNFEDAAIPADFFGPGGGGPSAPPVGQDTIILAVGGLGTVIRSTDVGETWDSLSSGTMSYLLKVSLGSDTHAIAVGIAATIIYTIDGGNTWNPGQLPTEVSPFSALFAVTHLSPDTAYAVGSSGLFLETTDAGATWTELSPGPRDALWDVHFPESDPNTGYAVGGQGYFLKTSDGGGEWNVIQTGRSDFYGSVFFLDSNTGFLVGNSDSLLKTTDGGQSWVAYSIGPASGAKTAVQFIDPDIGYIAALTVWKTTDGGLTWEELETGGFLGFEGLHFTDASNGVAVGLGGTIVKTSDGGDSWDLINSGTASWLYSVHFPDQSNGYIGGGDGTILKSIDGGDSWTNVGKGINLYQGVHFTGPDVGYAVGTNLEFPFGLFGTIKKTTDGGASWTELIETSTTANAINDVYFTGPDVGHIVGAGGSILKTTTGGVVSVDEAPTDVLPDDFFLAQNYPNPFNPTTTIRFALPEASVVTLTLYNLLGEEIVRLVDEQLSTGYHTRIWDASAYPSGIYFYRIQAGDFVKTKKLMLLK